VLLEENQISLFLMRHGNLKVFLTRIVQVLFSSTSNRRKKETTHDFFTRIVDMINAMAEKIAIFMTFYFPYG
jgi:hypothetical protein